MARTAGELIASGEKRLKRSPAIDHWPSGRERDEARRLLALPLRVEPDDLDEEATVTARAAERFDRLVRRRAGGEPMAHILGWTEFRGLRLSVRPGAFVPRQSSEFLAEQAVRRLRRRRRPVAVDVATGIGPIALAMGWALRRAEIHGVDLSADAVTQARANARALRLGNVRFHRGDLFAPLPKELRGAVDAVTLHPPYVPKDEVGDLPLEVRGFEPEHTLTDFSEHGLGLAQRTAKEGQEWLRPGGWILVEVSPDRARAIKGVLQRAGYRDVRSTKGWPEVTRVVVGRR
ncbi:MAG TPA: HemK/PrmC family methyltransferase [Actinomycetota bacterium]|nr:HemK/PrmC family methyltransferase [Actinomycetota bacterium]